MRRNHPFLWLCMAWLVSIHSPKASAGPKNPWIEKLKRHAMLSIQTAKGNVKAAQELVDLKTEAVSSAAPQTRHLILVPEATSFLPSKPAPSSKPRPKTKVRPKTRHLVLTVPKAARKSPAARPTRRPSRTKAGFGRTPLSSGIYRVSSEFGPRNGRIHHGIDLAAKPGTLIRAPGRGEVVESGWRKGYGYTIVLKHDSGLKTRYAHLQRKPPLKVGKRVKMGTRLGRVGQTGRASGPHLHFEVWNDGKSINPREYFRFSEGPMQAD